MAPRRRTRAHDFIVSTLRKVVKKALDENQFSVVLRAIDRLSIVEKLYKVELNPPNVPIEAKLEVNPEQQAEEMVEKMMKEFKTGGDDGTDSVPTGSGGGSQ